MHNWTMNNRNGQAIATNNIQVAQKYSLNNVNTRRMAERIANVAQIIAK